MANKGRQRPAASKTGRSEPPAPSAATIGNTRATAGVLIAAVIVVVLVVLAADFVFGSLLGGSAGGVPGK
jgi:hypothetical protein